MENSGRQEGIHPMDGIDANDDNIEFQDAHKILIPTV